MVNLPDTKPEMVASEFEGMAEALKGTGRPSNPSTNFSHSRTSFSYSASPLACFLIKPTLFVKLHHKCLINTAHPIFEEKLWTLQRYSYCC
jgi:hypothetical protein